MGIFEKLFKKETSSFLSPLSWNERRAVSNLNPLMYDVVMKEKRGEPVPTVVTDDETPFTILRKLPVADIEILMQSVEYSMKADKAVDSREQMQLYRKAAELNPYNDLALMSYGCAAANDGNLREGIKWVEKALKVNPDNARARRNLQGMKASLR